MMWLYILYIVFVVQMCYLKKRVYANTCCKSLHIRPLKGSFTAENKWDNPATPELCWYRKIRSCSAIYSLFFEMQFINLLPHISLSLQACQSAHMPSSAIANCWRCLSSEAKKWVQTIFAITGNVLSLKIFCTVWTFTLLDLYTHINFTGQLFRLVKIWWRQRGGKWKIKWFDIIKPSSLVTFPGTMLFLLYLWFQTWTNSSIFIESNLFFDIHCCCTTLYLQVSIILALQFNTKLDLKPKTSETLSHRDKTQLEPFLSWLRLRWD